MRAYEIPKGTKGLLLKNFVAGGPLYTHGLYDGSWETEPFTTRKDLLFCGEEMVIDCIHVHNGNSGFSHNSTVYKLAERGYTVFTVDPNVYQEYLLAIPHISISVR